MPVGGLTRRHVPAILAVAVGLGLVVGAGVWVWDLSREKYSYDLTPVGESGEYTVFDEVYATDDLSPAGRTVLERARNASGESASVTDLVATAPEFGGTGDYVVWNGSQVACLRLSSSRWNNDTDARHEPSCRTDDGQVVREFEALSVDAQAVVRAGLSDPDGRFVRYGETPPEFVHGTDVSQLNRGIYLVAYEGEYYELQIYTHRGFSTLFLQFLLGGAVVAGAGVAGAGGLSYRRRRARPAVAALAGPGVGGVLVVLASLGVIPRRIVLGHARWLAAGSVLAAALVWVLLGRRGRE